MVGAPGGKAPYQQAVPQAGGVTQALAFYIDDVDTHRAHTRKDGAKIVRPLETNDYVADYWANRTYGVVGQFSSDHLHSSRLEHAVSRRAVTVAFEVFPISEKRLLSSPGNAQHQSKDTCPAKL